MRKIVIIQVITVGHYKTVKFIFFNFNWVFDTPGDSPSPQLTVNYPMITVTHTFSLPSFFNSCASYLCVCVGGGTVVVRNKTTYG